MADEPNEARSAVVTLHNALEILLEWDKSRDFIMPYRIREVIQAALQKARSVLAAPASLPPLDERLKEHAAARVDAARAELHEALAEQSTLGVKESDRG